MMHASLDQANARFWDELCGSTFARQLGITDHSLDSLRRFDHAYFERYPYLLRRVPVATLRGRKVLEVGLGYGTLGQRIAESGAHYTGLDVAEGPVRMMSARLKMCSLQGSAARGNALRCPFPDESFDCVVSIGCFHHTGDIQRCVDETWRVLRPGGRAYLMVYSRYSYLRWLKWFGPTVGSLLGGEHTASESERRTYDSDSAGKAAPETAFVSRAELRRMLKRFSAVSLALENTTHLGFRGRTIIPRRYLLGSVGRLAGLDIYVNAEK
jgi:SAM-dependent methyltransferase